MAESPRTFVLTEEELRELLSAAIEGARSCDFYLINNIYDRLNNVCKG